MSAPTTKPSSYTRLASLGSVAQPTPISRNPGQVVLRVLRSLAGFRIHRRQNRSCRKRVSDSCFGGRGGVRWHEPSCAFAA